MYLAVFQSHALSDVASDAQSSLAVENVELTFLEEPLGLRADQGYGYLQVDFGQRIGPSGQYEILRKLGWGLNVSYAYIRRNAIIPDYYAFRQVYGLPEITRI